MSCAFQADWNAATTSSGRFNSVMLLTCNGPQSSCNGVGCRRVPAILELFGMRIRHSIVLLTAMLGACSSPGGPYPSLRPRAAEAIDPRVPVTRPMNERPVTPALASRLAVLVDEAESGEAAFDGPASEAERLAAAAGD